jgi:hypothetical protein
MSNVFVNLPVPATPGVGASVDVSTVGPEKSLILEGPGGLSVPTGAYGFLSLEVSEDGTTFSPFQSLSLLADPGVPSFTVICSHMRIRRMPGFASTGVTATVAGESSTSNSFATLVVPVTGDGPGLNTSTIGGQKTVSVVGNYDGNLVIEGSVNGGVTYDPVITCNTGSSDTFVLKGIWQYMRVRRIGSSIGAPSVSVGGHPIAMTGASANTCILKWGGLIYVPSPNGSVPDPYIRYYSDATYSSCDIPFYYVMGASGTVSQLQVRVISNDCDGIGTAVILNGVTPTTQSVTIPAGGTGTYVTAGAGAAFALNNPMAMMMSIAGDRGAHEMFFTAMCIYTIS